MEFLIAKVIEGIGEASGNFLLMIIFTLTQGVLVRNVIVASGHKWAKTTHNTLTYFLLPMIGAVISEVISGSIALSLGMIGALSIVRFRHPVKSPFELTIYFLLVTLGVTTSASPAKGFILCAIAMATLYLYSTQKALRESLSSNKPIDIQLGAANSKILIEVKANSSLPQLSNDRNLIFSNENKVNSSYYYKLSMDSRLEAEAIKSKLNDETTVVEVSMTSYDGY